MKGKRLFFFNLRMVCSRSDNYETLEKSLESQWLPPALFVKVCKVVWYLAFRREEG